MVRHEVVRQGGEARVSEARALVLLGDMSGYYNLLNHWDRLRDSLLHADQPTIETNYYSGTNSAMRIK